MESLDDLLGETATLGESRGVNKNRRPRPEGNDKAKSGWGFGDSSSKKAEAPPSAPSTEPIRQHDFGGDDDAGDAIPVIPDLEDDQDEDLSKQIAAPPIVSTDRDFRSLRELEPDNAEKKLLLSTSAQQGIDLSSLMSVMSPYQMVTESDDVWDYNLLFQEVASHINDVAAANKKTGGTGAAPPSR
mmetsp:Transcript_10585/g.25799  ORF Transcript_10585/g.25799 Transcript_10585/m.25799 type:complete len:186 (+) Transcript_10585:81-638(+)